MRALLLAAGLLAVGLAGCTLPATPVGGFDGSLVLTYRLRNDSGASMGAEPGHHCGQAELDGGRLRVDRDAYSAIGKPKRLLYTDATLEGEWRTTGDGPIVQGFPAYVQPFDGGEPGGEGITLIEWDGRVAKVHGQPVDLPHEWTVSDPGNWTATLLLSEGPSRLTVYGPYSCE